MISEKDFNSVEKDDFETKKTKYFTKIGLAVRDALRMHSQEGLWERNENNIRDWGNVPEHCLVEAARVSVLAKELQLSQEVTTDLIMAAAAHDFFKKTEKKYLEGADDVWEGHEEAGQEAHRIITDKLGARAARFADSVAHSSLTEMEEILKNDSPDDDDVACLIMHYVDDYTTGSDWSNPPEKNNESWENDLDRRMYKNEKNPRYQKINQGGVGRFKDNETTYQAQRRIGKMVEKRLTELLLKRANKNMEYPEQLPSIIDDEIRREIASVGY